MLETTIPRSQGRYTVLKPSLQDITTMPDPFKLLNTLRRACNAFRNTPGRRGRFVQITDAESVVVAGDLHGNLTNFKKLLDLADLAKHPRRHLVVQELIHGGQRYPDGSDASHRALDLLAALKCQYPDRVHMLLGNHEMAQWTRRQILKAEEDLNQMFRLGVETAYGRHAETIYATYEELFAVLPLAIRTPNRVLLSHSMPNGKTIASWDPACLHRDDWTDEDVGLHGGLYAVAWGRDTRLETAEQFLAKMDADLLITGHIPCDEGFSVPNARQIILDTQNENGCICCFAADRPVTQADLEAGLVRLATGKHPAESG